MISGYYFDISAFTVLLCLLFAFLVEHSYEMQDNNIHASSMLMIMGASVLGMIRNGMFNIPHGSETIIRVSSAMLTTIGLLLFTFYIYRSLVYHLVTRRLLLILGLPLLGALAAEVAAAVSGDRLFVVAGAVVEVIILLEGMIVIVIYRRNVAKERLRLIMIVYVLTLAAFCAEIYFAGLYIKRFAFSLLLAETLFGLKNPEENYDKETNLLGYDAMRDMVMRRLYYLQRHKGEVAYIVVGAIHDTEANVKLLGEVNELLLRRAVISEIARIAGSTTVFRMDRGIYVYVIDEGGVEEAERIKGELSERFKGTFGEGAYEMLLPYTVCLMELPEVASTTNGLMDMIHMVVREGKLKKKTLIDMSQIDLDHERTLKEIDHKIRHAVEDGNLEVYYQPIYSVKEKRYVSAEALLRLHDGDGFIPPDVFIPLAENNGSIIEIDDYVIQQVCKMIAGRRIEDLGIRYIEINLSAPDMIQDDLADKLSKFVDMYHIRPGQLNLEITETSADAFTGVVEDNVLKLSRMGFSFSLDDFGTGYSSLSRIIMLPFEIIKLDKTIVQPPYTLETEEERSRAMTLLESSSDMIKRIGAESVAEGVETKEQLEKLASLDTDFIQGYYFSRPLPEAEFINAVKEMNMK